MAKKKRQRDQPKFKVGDRIRVKKGISYIDYPDMPLGGWAGTINKVLSDDTFLIRWSQETLDAICTGSA